MARAISLLGAALLVSSVGCIYATGVQDYKVDEGAVSTGGGDDACKAIGESTACISCCADHHPIEAHRFNPDLANCACGDPGTCATDCSGGFCANPNTPINGTPCGNCVNAHVDASSCPALAANAYYLCSIHC